MKGLLLAGGHGTRLRPLTYTGNKHMLPIANKPMLMYGFEHLRSVGIREIGIVLGPLHEGIRESFGDGSKFNVKITYIDQPDPKGIAHAVLISKKFLDGDSFIVYLGDNLLKESIPRLANEFQESGADAMVVVSKVKDPSRFGVVKIHSEKIVKLVEKPKQFLSDLALTGVYFLRPSIFPVIETLQPSWRNELEITEAIQTILEGGGKVKYHTVSGWWKDTGRPEDILEANRLVLNDLKTSIKGKVEDGVTVSGNAEVAEGTVVRRGASIRGPVTIGEDSEIGEDACVGPFTSIGSRVKILGAEIENSIVLDGTIIDCKERIVDSIIGKNSKIVSNLNSRPSGRRFVIGESTFVSL
ncbi:MAG: glucose-1-phosphate thymidylyltransferase [Crenarchaeota archaeon 13_1_40CM_3_53_5]|nr:MAG: glucose-1-phosphate thymidylyltransferase [Crenarchaeota archaeon 13_1_40CM_3_53_5]